MDSEYRKLCDRLKRIFSQAKQEVAKSFSDESKAITRMLKKGKSTQSMDCIPYVLNTIASAIIGYITSESIKDMKIVEQKRKKYTDLAIALSQNINIEEYSYFNIKRVYFHPLQFYFTYINTPKVWGLWLHYTKKAKKASISRDCIVSDDVIPYYENGKQNTKRDNKSHRKTKTNKSDKKKQYPKRNSSGMVDVVDGINIVDNIPTAKKSQLKDSNPEKRPKWFKCDSSSDDSDSDSDNDSDSDIEDSCYPIITVCAVIMILTPSENAIIYVANEYISRMYNLYSETRNEMEDVWYDFNNYIYKSFTDSFMSYKQEKEELFEFSKYDSDSDSDSDTSSSSSSSSIKSCITIDTCVTVGTNLSFGSFNSSSTTDWSNIKELKDSFETNEIKDKNRKRMEDITKVLNKRNEDLKNMLSDNQKVTDFLGERVCQHWKENGYCTRDDCKRHPELHPIKYWKFCKDPGNCKKDGCPYRHDWRQKKYCCYDSLIHPYGCNTMDTNTGHTCGYFHASMVQRCNLHGKTINGRFIARSPDCEHCIRFPCGCNRALCMICPKYKARKSAMDKYRNQMLITTGDEYEFAEQKFIENFVFPSQDEEFYIPAFPNIDPAPPFFGEEAPEALEGHYFDPRKFVKDNLLRQNHPTNVATMSGNTHCPVKARKYWRPTQTELDQYAWKYLDGTSIRCGRREPPIDGRQHPKIYRSSAQFFEWFENCVMPKNGLSLKRETPILSSINSSSVNFDNSGKLIISMGTSTVERQSRYIDDRVDAEMVTQDDIDKQREKLGDERRLKRDLERQKKKEENQTRNTNRSSRHGKKVQFAGKRVAKSEKLDSSIIPWANYLYDDKSNKRIRLDDDTSFYATLQSNLGNQFIVTPFGFPNSKPITVKIGRGFKSKFYSKSAIRRDGPLTDERSLLLVQEVPETKIYWAIFHYGSKLKHPNIQSLIRDGQIKKEFFEKEKDTEEDDDMIIFEKEDSEEMEWWKIELEVALELEDKEREIRAREEIKRLELQEEIEYQEDNDIEEEEEQELTFKEFLHLPYDEAIEREPDLFYELQVQLEKQGVKGARIWKKLPSYWRSGYLNTSGQEIQLMIRSLYYKGDTIHNIKTYTLSIMRKKLPDDLRTLIMEFTTHLLTPITSNEDKGRSEVYTEWLRWSSVFHLYSIAPTEEKGRSVIYAEWLKNMPTAFDYLPDVTFPKVDVFDHLPDVTLPMNMRGLSKNEYKYHFGIERVVLPPNMILTYKTIYTFCGYQTADLDASLIAGAITIIRNSRPIP